jgi:hypothetical protein
VEKEDQINNTKESTEQEMTEAEMEEKMIGMSDMEKRLFKVRMRINQGRKANKAEVEREFNRFTDPKFEKRQNDDWQERKAEKEDLLNQNGLKKSEAYLLDTAEKSERAQDKINRKEANKATFGWEAFTMEASYKAYSKQLSKLPSYVGVEPNTEKTLESNPFLYGKIGTGASTEGLKRLSQEIENREKVRDGFSRRRTTQSAANVDFINDKNEHFNKKIKRAYDKYTVEIRQNLERGTAL